MKILGKAFNRRIKKEARTIREEVQGYLDLLNELPIEEKISLIPKIEECLKVIDGIQNMDDKEDFCEASFCLMSSYDDIKERMVKFVETHIEICSD
jgi:hypothetical protein